jgi:hypothetical protein
LPLIVAADGPPMSDQDAKKHMFRLAYRHSPETPDEVIARAVGVSVRTIQRWRRELREQSIRVQADTCHCFKILGRA